MTSIIVAYPRSLQACKHSPERGDVDRSRETQDSWNISFPYSSLPSNLCERIASARYTALILRTGCTVLLISEPVPAWLKLLTRK